MTPEQKEKARLHEELVTRIWNGLFYSDKDTIRHQLESEGLSSVKICAALHKAERMHESRKNGQ